MQLDQDAVARGGLQDFLDELDVILVVVVEEIDHHPAPAKLLELGERFFHPPPQRRLMHPGPQSHVV